MFGLYFFFGIKFILAIIFIIAGGVCYSNVSCNVTEQISAGFIGFGTGMIICVMVSIIVLIVVIKFVLNWQYSFLQARQLFIGNLLVTILLLIPGIILCTKTDQYQNTIGAGLIGTGLGICLSSIFTMIIVINFLVKNVPVNSNLL